jgi:hypothetical protein
LNITLENEDQAVQESTPFRRLARGFKLDADISVPGLCQTLPPKVVIYIRLWLS